MTGADTGQQDRVDEIERYDVVERAPRTELVAIVELAAKVCGTPMATINLIGEVEQHQVATYGFDAAICRREDSMCANVLDEVSPILVADASRDPRFRDNPFVTGVLGNVRFYASHKLVTLSGVTIGTLCVFDELTRHLDDSQVDALATLADRVVDVLELGWRSRQLAASNERLSTFAGRVSHDLKTPLATLSMSLGLLREQLAEGIDSETASGLLERAINGSNRMAAMIDDVLSYASLGGGCRWHRCRWTRSSTRSLPSSAARSRGWPSPELRCRSSWETARSCVRCSRTCSTTPRSTAAHGER